MKSDAWYLHGWSAQGGYLPFAPGVSTVRYPIPERIFDYVSTVQSAASGEVSLSQVRGPRAVRGPGTLLRRASNAAACQDDSYRHRSGHHDTRYKPRVPR